MEQRKAAIYSSTHVNVSCYFFYEPVFNWKESSVLKNGFLMSGNQRDQINRGIV